MDHSQEFLFTYTIVTLSTDLTTQKGDWAALLQQGSTNALTTCMYYQLGRLVRIKHDQHRGSGKSQRYTIKDPAKLA